MTVKYEDAMVISLTVVTDNAEHATKAAEMMARIATGLVLDGVNVTLSLGRPDDEEEEEEEVE